MWCFKKKVKELPKPKYKVVEEKVLKPINQSIATVTLKCGKQFSQCCVSNWANMGGDYVNITTGEKGYGPNSVYVGGCLYESKNTLTLMHNSVLTMVDMDTNETHMIPYEEIEMLSHSEEDQIDEETYTIKKLVKVEE